MISGNLNGYHIARKSGTRNGNTASVTEARVDHFSHGWWKGSREQKRKNVFGSALRLASRTLPINGPIIFLEADWLHTPLQV